MENRSGLMNLGMKETGQTIKLMDSENCSMLMEIFMKETGEMIKLTAEGPILMQTEQSIQENGRTISSTELELKHGLTMLSMKGSIMKVRKMEEGN
jgi:hypothetical protein